MKRVNVTIPEELVAQVRATLPGLNLSALVQQALRAAMVCPHTVVVCACCGIEVDLVAVFRDRLDALYLELIEALENLLWAGGTVEGSARIAKTVFERLGVPMARQRPLPRLSRARREADREAAKHRHPSNLEEAHRGLCDRSVPAA